MPQVDKRVPRSFRTPFLSCHLPAQSPELAKFGPARQVTRGLGIRPLFSVESGGKSAHPDVQILCNGCSVSSANCFPRKEPTLNVDPVRNSSLRRTTLSTQEVAPVAAYWALL